MDVERVIVLVCLHQHKQLHCNQFMLILLQVTRKYFNLFYIAWRTYDQLLKVKVRFWLSIKKGFLTRKSQNEKELLWNKSSIRWICSAGHWTNTWDILEGQGIKPPFLCKIISTNHVWALLLLNWHFLKISIVILCITKKTWLQPKGSHS